MPSRNDLIGAIFAVIAIAMVAWLSLDGWFIADCQERLKAQDVVAHAHASDADPSLQACLDRFGAPADLDAESP